MISHFLNVSAYCAKPPLQDGLSIIRIPIRIKNSYNFQEKGQYYKKELAQLSYSWKGGQGTSTLTKHAH